MLFKDQLDRSKATCSFNHHGNQRENKDEDEEDCIFSSGIPSHITPPCQQNKSSSITAYHPLNTSGPGLSVLICLSGHRER